MAILFLDFDGVLHPNGAFRHSNGRIVLDADGHDLFEHAELLAGILDPYPRVEIVLSTSWVPTLGFATAKECLPDALQRRLVGTTWQGARIKLTWDSMTRYQQINAYVARRRLTNWIAVEDDDIGWPADKRRHLVHTNEWNGLGDTKAQQMLSAWLDSLKAGWPA
ncbi:HAD domain-containing protein [Sideroxydans sp. CL21]|uniref:HAD domain-containing protein n=1 Tax=Sideroxydans sp. CL21 TaxID=2600596 RepID=UPI0024BC356B|nr:HAD domain-containing protein [Sideroxydans sp. CL21]